MSDPNQTRNSHNPPDAPPPIHHDDDFMQTVDERDHISRAGLDLPSAYIPEHDDGLVGLREALATCEEDGSGAKGIRLSLSTLVIDLALTIRRKCHQLRIKKHKPVDFDVST